MDKSVALEEGDLGTVQDRWSQVERSPFTERAFEALTSTIDAFIGDLVKEAGRTASRHGSEVISVKHVQHAGEYLVAKKSGRLLRNLGTVGGILLGGSLSNILSMSQLASFPVVGTLLTLVVALIGTAMVAIHIVLE